VSAPNAGLARAVTRMLLAACSPGGDASQAPASAAFRCWTPYRDWEQGEAGIGRLRQVMASFCGHAGGGQFRPQAVITDGEAVVVEAVTAAGPGQPRLSVTLVLALSTGRVDEVKVYVDPRALGALP
jgi:hypothetical protein